MSKPNRIELDVVRLPIDDIKPYELNPREHPEKQIEAATVSIRRYGFLNPVLVNRDKQLIAGHCRIAAARRAGLDEIPAIMLAHLSEAEERAYRIADNAIALKGAWSVENLATEVEFVLTANDAFDFSALDLGFETGELDFLLSPPIKKASRQAEVVPDIDHVQQPVSRLGDIWTIGDHRIVCGNSIERESLMRTMGDERADFVLTDMPYNLKVNGQVGGRGKIQHPEFAMGSGEMSRAEFADFIRASLELQIEFSRAGAVNAQFNDWRMVGLTLAIGEAIFEQLLSICVWAKPTPGMGNPWRNQHELVVVHRVAGAKHTNNVQLGRMGRNRSTLWEYPSPTGFGPEREKLKIHPTCKNVEMLADVIMDVTDRDDIVLDPFLGSGSTALACHQVGRRCRGIEIDPHYVDLSVRRLVEATGLEAVDNVDRTFEEVRAMRVQADGGERE